MLHYFSGAPGFKCERCSKVFAYEYYRDKHLKYTRCVDQGDRKFPCGLCSRSFEKRDRLRIHILHVHEKHRPHKCHVCDKSFSQSSSLNKHMRVSQTVGQAVNQSGIEVLNQSLLKTSRDNNVICFSVL